MSINVNVDLGRLDGITGRFKDGQKWAANQALAEMEQFVPKRNNYLRDSGTIDIDGSSLHYTMPYAHAQFTGLIDSKYPIHNYTTPGTGARWDLRLKGDSQKMAHVKKAFINGAKLRGSSQSTM